MLYLAAIVWSLASFGCLAFHETKLANMFGIVAALFLICALMDPKDCEPISPH